MEVDVRTFARGERQRRRCERDGPACPGGRTANPAQPVPGWHCASLISRLTAHRCNWPDRKSCHAGPLPPPPRAFPPAGREVQHPGTYLGVAERAAHIRAVGANAVVVTPCYATAKGESGSWCAPGPTQLGTVFLIDLICPGGTSGCCSLASLQLRSPAPSGWHSACVSTSSPNPCSHPRPVPACCPGRHRPAVARGGAPDGCRPHARLRRQHQRGSGCRVSEHGVSAARGRHRGLPHGKCPQPTWGPAHGSSLVELQAGMECVEDMPLSGWCCEHVERWAGSQFLQERRGGIAALPHRPSLVYRAGCLARMCNLKLCCWLLMDPSSPFRLLPPLRGSWNSPSPPRAPTPSPTHSRFAAWTMAPTTAATGWVAVLHWRLAAWKPCAEVCMCNSLLPSTRQ